MSYGRNGISKRRVSNNPNLVPNLVTQVTRPDTISSGQTRGGTIVEFRSVEVGSTQINIGVGDDIQKAVDSLHSLGGGKVFIKNGTHFVSSDIVLYSHIIIEGETSAGTVVDFGSAMIGS